MLLALLLTDNLDLHTQLLASDACLANQQFVAI